MNFNRYGKYLGAGALALAIAIITHFEGEVRTTYLDPVAIPTICVGHTGQDVKPHQEVTHEACQDMLQKDIQVTWDGISACIQTPLSDHQQAAFISFAFNVGVRRFCSSTMAKLINKGDLVAACNELPKWIYAQGQVLPGLVNRRKAEQALCLSH